MHVIGLRFPEGNAIFSFKIRVIGLGIPSNVEIVIKKRVNPEKAGKMAPLDNGISKIRQRTWEILSSKRCAILAFLKFDMRHQNPPRAPNRADLLIPLLSTAISPQGVRVSHAQWSLLGVSAERVTC